MHLEPDHYSHYLFTASDVLLLTMIHSSAEPRIVNTLGLQRKIMRRRVVGWLVGPV
jgi:hypothetical protein